MTEEEKEYAAWCVANDPWQFYQWSAWKHKRKEVLEMDKYECQICRNKYKRYRRANTVHHVNHLRLRPDLALEIFYTDIATHKQKRNLISLCHDCHEEVHGYRMKQEEEPITSERWD